MNGAIATRLGRPDLNTDAAASGSTGYQDAAGMPDGFLTGTTAAQGATGQRGMADFQGRLSAGMLALIVLGLVGVYVFTRKYQG